MTIYKYLTNIYGIGDYKAIKLCIYIGVSPKTLFNQLSTKKKDILSKALTFYRKSKNAEAIGDNLKNFNKNQIKRKIVNNSLSGRRYKLRLPSRGQRTRTNAKTAKLLNKLIFNEK